MNVDSENMMPNGRSMNTTRLPTNKPLHKPTHHQVKSGKSKVNNIGNNNNGTIGKLSSNNKGNKRRALGDITNKRNALQQAKAQSQKQSSSLSKKAFGKSNSNMNAFKIHTDSPPRSSSLNINIYDDRIPQDGDGNVLSPENIPGVPSGPTFEQPDLFDSDSDEEFKKMLRNKKNRKSKKKDFDIFNDAIGKEFNSPVQKPQSGSSHGRPPIFDDFHCSPVLSSNGPSKRNDDNLFNECDSPQLELNYF